MIDCGAVDHVHVIHSGNAAHLTSIYSVVRPEHWRAPTTERNIHDQKIKTEILDKEASESHRPWQ